jgi:hypothetical protein
MPITQQKIKHLLYCLMQHMQDEEWSPDDLQAVGWSAHLTQTLEQVAATMPLHTEQCLLQ